MSLGTPQAIAVDNAGRVYARTTALGQLDCCRHPVTSPVLTISSRHAGNFTAGQNGTYTLIVKNAVYAGPTSGTVTVTETLPAGFTLVSMSGSGSNCVANTCARGDTVTSGTYPPITATVSVGAPVPWQVTNRAAVSGGGAAAAGAEDLAGDPANPAQAQPILLSPDHQSHGRFAHAQPQLERRRRSKLPTTSISASRRHHRSSETQRPPPTHQPR